MKFYVCVCVCARAFLLKSKILFREQVRRADEFFLRNRRTKLSAPSAEQQMDVRPSTVHPPTRSEHAE